MKIHFDLPWGGVLHIERPKAKPMEDETKILLFFLGVVGLAMIMLISSI